jgi:ParB family chromosome partitioning protein
MAGFERIPALVRETPDDEMLPLSLIENLLRENLNPIEEAMAYQALADAGEWTQGAIARQIGKSRAHVANTLRLLQLPEDIQADVMSSAISPGHARALLACSSSEEMYALRDRILSQGLSVRESEEQSTPKTPPRRKRRRKTTRVVSPETRELEERLQRAYGTLVQIHDRKGRGRVSLDFYSYDDLGRLLELLLQAEERSPASPRGR